MPLHCSPETFRGTARRTLAGEGGAALVTALMLTALSLVIAMALLYTVTSGTRISASQKRYRSALAAAQGGVELVTGGIVPRLLQPEPQTGSSLEQEFSLINLKLPDYDCLKQKLSFPTAAWSACSARQGNSDPSDTPDLSFVLGSGQAADPGYSVTMKIVDSVPGNTDTSANELLEQGSSVAGSEQGIRPQHVPGMFSIAVQGVGDRSRERARLSLLYAY